MSMEQKPEGATTVFVLGLLGLLLCQVFGIAAWIMGNSYVSKCSALGVEPEGLGVAGRIMGMISTVLFVLVILGSAAVFIAVILGHGVAR